MTTQNLLPLTNTFTPADQAAVAEAVRTAYGEKTAIYPAGGRTRLDYGAWPTTSGMALSLEKINRLVDNQPDDLTITVEAGMTMAELSKILIKRHQRLPIDIALPERSTIGGAVAVNTAGPRRFAFGTIRDYVLGFTAVDGQGKIFSGGGRVLKNNAGYNLSRLMAGSFGTLGVITQLTLLVRPLPEMSAVAACDLPDLAAAEKLIAELLQSPIRPVAVELAVEKGSELFNSIRQPNPVFDPISEGHAARLYVGFEGPAVEVQWMLDVLHEKWQAAGIASPMTVTDASAKLLWDWLTDIPAHVQISVQPSAATKTIGTLVSLDPNCTIQASAGNGILQVMFSLQKIAAHTSNEDQPEVNQLPYMQFIRSELRPLISAIGGKMVVVNNYQSSGLTCRDVWGPKGDGFAIMQSLKDRFDPAGILNPGRYIFDHS